MTYRDKDNKPLSQKDYLKRARKENPEKFKMWKQDWMDANPKKRLLYFTRVRAKAINIEHTLSEEDIVIPTHCPYLGIELETTNRMGNRFTSPSVDRVDNSKGYVKGNIEVISFKANIMKGTASIEELVFFAHKVLEKWQG